MQNTRREILNILKREGSASLEQLAARLGIVPVTVRSHLNILERDGLVGRREVRIRGPGRPFYSYYLTPAAEDLFPKRYDALANRLLRCVQHLAGDKDSDLATHLGKCWAADHQHRLAGKEFRERMEEIAAIRTEEGAWPELEPISGGLILRQYNCPCACVAQKNPDIICTAELHYLSTLVGQSIQRVEWQIQGDHTCAYFIPQGGAEQPVEKAS